MAHGIRRELSALVVFSVVALLARATSEAPLNGARPMGMGGAFTAVADDANAALYNPAGLAATAGANIALTRAAYFSGLADPVVSQDVAHIVVGSGRNGYAVGITSLADGDAIYRETVVSAGYARALGENLKLGFMVKRIGIGLDDANPDVRENPYFANGTSVSAITVDIGALVSPTPGLTLGAAARNVAPADLTFATDGSAEADEAPLLARLGVAYRLSSVAGSAEQQALQGILRRSTIAADFTLGGATTGLAVGAELGLTNILTARVGYRTASGHGESVAALTVGGSVGVALEGGPAMAIDYAADVAGGDLRDSVTQRVSLRGAF